MSASDKIWFHKQVSEVLYADLTRETLFHKKAIQKIEKLEAHLKQEKATNKAWSTQVAQLQTELAGYKELPSVPGAEAQPAVKVKSVKTFKRRGRAMNVNVDTTPDLVKLHDEIADLKLKVIEENAKTLILEGEKKALEEEKNKLLHVIEQLNSNKVTEPLSPIDQITLDIAGISVKEKEIADLKEKNSELMQEIEKLQTQDSWIEEINKLKEDKAKLDEKISKLKEKVKGILPLEGAKHLLWDELSKDIQFFRPQLVIVEEHEKVLEVAFSRCKLAEEKLANMTQEVAQNAVNFLSKTPAADLQVLKVSNRTVLLVDARKVLHKYALLNSVKDKIAQIQQTVQDFKRALTPLFNYGLPSFWDGDGKLIVEPVYKEMMIKAKSDHGKFKDMVKGLKGTVVVNKMRQEFELPILFREIRPELPIFTKDPLTELDVLVKEMADAFVPNDNTWKEIFRVGKRVLLKAPTSGRTNEAQPKQK